MRGGNLLKRSCFSALSMIFIHIYSYDVVFDTWWSPARCDLREAQLATRTLRKVVSTDKAAVRGTLKTCNWKVTSSNTIHT